MTPKTFVGMLAETQLPSTFNPWRDRCAMHDLEDSADRRRDNLLRFLEAALDAAVGTMWIARDLGWRGGRRTGVPLTDEMHLETAGRLMGGIRLGRATAGPVVAERTAAVVWSMLASIGEPVVLWNVFPFHPHEPGAPLTNRCHTRSEREATSPLLHALIGMIRPSSIVAIGRDAQLALADLDVPVVGVRHPSYGGQAEFVAGVRRHYAVVGTSGGASDLADDQQVFPEFALT